MNGSRPNPGERIRDVHLTEDTLAVDLQRAPAEQRSRWTIAGAGYGIHWPELDEDLSTEGWFAVDRTHSSTIAESP